MAITGLLSLIISVSLVLIIKSNYIPPEMTISKILTKAGLESNFLTEMLKPFPVRPPGLKFPDPGAFGWTGHGARRNRILKPVVFQKGQRPVPLSWLTSQDQDYSITQGYDRIVPVNDAKEFLTSIRHAKAGDVITLAPGVYRIRASNIKVNSPGTPKLPIVVRAKKFGDVFLEMDTLEGFWVSSFFSFNNTQSIQD
jgi:hypothetical protein